MGGRRDDDGAGARYGDLGRILIVASTSSPPNFNNSGRVIAMADAGDQTNSCVQTDWTSTNLDKCKNWLATNQAKFAPTSKRHGHLGE